MLMLIRALWSTHRKCPVVTRLCTVPGVGILTAVAISTISGNPNEFKNGMQFVAFLGLVPRQVSTGGKSTLLGITKRGDTVTKALLIQGARSVVRSKLVQQPSLALSLLGG